MYNCVARFPLLSLLTYFLLQVVVEERQATSSMDALSVVEVKCPIVV